MLVCLSVCESIVLFVYTFLHTCISLLDDDDNNGVHVCVPLTVNVLAITYDDDNYYTYTFLFTKIHSY